MRPIRRRADFPRFFVELNLGLTQPLPDSCLDSYHFRTRGLNRVFFERENTGCAQPRVGPCAKSPNRTGGAIALKTRARLNPAGDPRNTPVIEVLYPSLGVHTEAFWSAAATKRARPRRFSLVLKRAIAAGARISWRWRSQKPLYAPLS